jgi:hypothetical protein
MFSQSRQRIQVTRMIRKSHVFAHRKFCLILLLISQATGVRTPPNLIQLPYGMY